jgi:hypothetical protein
MGTRPSRAKEADMLKVLPTAAAAVFALGVLCAPAANAITTAEADYVQDPIRRNRWKRGGPNRRRPYCLRGLGERPQRDDLSATYHDNAVVLSHAQADAAVNLAIKDLCRTG